MIDSARMITEFVKWIYEFPARRRAEKIAKETFQKMFPNEMVMSTWVCADESSRYVVRVFCGARVDSNLRNPPWKNCFIFAVAKNGNTAEQIDDKQYQPVIR